MAGVLNKPGHGGKAQGVATQRGDGQTQDWQVDKSVLECNKYMFEEQINCDVTFQFNIGKKFNNTALLNQNVNQKLGMVILGGSRGRVWRTPPLRVQILSFLHIKFSKHNCLGSPRPPTGSATVNLNDTRVISSFIRCWGRQAAKYEDICTHLCPGLQKSGVLCHVYGTSERTNQYNTNP